MKPEQAFAPTRLEDIADRLPYKGEPKTVDQMNRAIKAELKRKWQQ